MIFIDQPCISKKGYFMRANWFDGKVANMVFTTNAVVHFFINCDGNAWFENKAFWSVICKHTISGSLTTSAKTDAKKKVPFFWLIIAQGENISNWNKDQDALETWVYFQYFTIRGTLGISPIQKHNIKSQMDMRWISCKNCIRFQKNYKNEHRRVYQKLGTEFKYLCHWCSSEF